MKLVTTAAAGALIGVASIALAHSGATGIVKERMDAMMTLGEALKTVTPIMRGQTEYDADAVRDFANIVELHAGDAMTRLFPEGSTDKSEAKPTVWTDWETFEAMAMELEIMALGLHDAASNGLMDGGSSMMSGSGMMGESTSDMMGGSGSGMMGGGSGPRTVEDIAKMPADAAFMMLSQTCSACHTRFREETD